MLVEEIADAEAEAGVALARLLIDMQMPSENVCPWDRRIDPNR